MLADPINMLLCAAGAMIVGLWIVWVWWDVTGLWLGIALAAFGAVGAWLGSSPP